MPSACMEQSLSRWISTRAQRLLDWLEAPSGGPLATAKRLILTLGLVLLLGIIPWNLDAGRARWWAPAAILLIVLIFLTGLGLGQSIGPKIMQAMRGQQQLSIWGGRIKLEVPDFGIDRGVELFWQALRRVGILLPALMFFFFWALIYIAVWAWDPTACSADPAVVCNGSFGGLGANPLFGDLLYYAVNMAFANPVPDVIGRSHLVHTFNTVELTSSPRINPGDSS